MRTYRLSVVSIAVKKTANDTGAVTTVHGTGFIIDHEGHVITSHSLFSKSVKDSDPDIIEISGSIGSQKATKEEMTFLTSSPVGDVAVLRFSDTSKDRKPISVGDPWSVRNGQSFCFMGFPLDIEFLTKQGIVTGRARNDWWYSDMPYNDGTGGAPVFDSRDGGLIGIVGVSRESEIDARGFGYIVPINLAYVSLQEFANIEIKRQAAQTLASGLQNLDATSTQVTAPTAELRDRGSSLLKMMWQNTNIPVCWENPSAQFQREMSLVRKEVAATWEKESLLRFSGWQRCAGENRGLRIKIEDSVPHTKVLGRKLDGVPNGLVLNFTFANWSSSCQSTRDYCIKAIAGHMFGHAIGLGHTQNRPDAPKDCQQLAQGETVDILLTPYDPDSIMNYCNTKFYNNGNLSKLDIEALHILYGAPRKGESDRP